MGRVLHTGQAIVDLVMRVSAMPPLGGDVFARTSDFTAGGGFNVLAAAARDRATTVYLGAHGDGPFGRIVRDALAAERVAVPAPITLGLDTGYCVAIIDDDAERTFISFLGAEGQVNLHHLRAVIADDTDIVYVSGYSLLHETHRAALLVWLPTLPNRIRIVFDPSPLLDQIPDDAWDLLANRAWLWTLNAREAALGIARFGEATVTTPAAATVLARHLTGGVVVRAGADGAYLVPPGQHGPGTHLRGFAVTPVDTNGAGDAHTGVLCATLASGGELTTAVHRANAAAALAITRPGPATSPTAEDIDALVSVPPGESRPGR